MASHERPPAHEAIVGNLSAKVRQTVETVTAAKGLETWSALKQGHGGKIEIAGKPMQCLVSGSETVDEKVATITLIDSMGVSAKISDINFHVTPGANFVPSESRLGRMFNRGTIVEDIRLSLDERTTFSYEAGRKYKHTELVDIMAPEFAFNPFEILLDWDFGERIDPVVSSKITFREKDGSPQLLAIDQYAVLTNPDLPAPIVVARFAGGPPRHEKLPFLVEIAVVDIVDGKKIESIVVKKYEAGKDDPDIYEGKRGGVMLRAHLPTPYTVEPKSDEVARMKKGRINSGRIERYMPKAFSQQEADQMISNIVGGKVFTAGVWNPLDITGARRVSKKPN